MTWLKAVCIFVCIALCVFALSGCGWGRFSVYDTTSSDAKRIMRDALPLIEAKDAEKLQQMFAANAQIAQPDLENQIRALLSYCECSSGRLEISAAEVRQNFDGKGGKTADCLLTGEITSEPRHLVAMRVVTEDRHCPDNVGIWSIYLIRAADEPDYPEFAYWGGVRTDSAGAYVGIKN